MTSSPSSVPTVSPYLVVENVDALIDFTTACFDAEEIDRQHRPDGSIAAASVRIGESVVMMAEDPTNTDTARIHVYVDDVETVYQQALDAGATSLTAPEDAPGGPRAGVQDPSGTQWWISTSPPASTAA